MFKIKPPPSSSSNMFIVYLVIEVEILPLNLLIECKINSKFCLLK